VSGVLIFMIDKTADIVVPHLLRTCIIIIIIEKENESGNPSLRGLALTMLLIDETASALVFCFLGR
jgi:hypothetical protein